MSSLHFTFLTNFCGPSWYWHLGRFPIPPKRVIDTTEVGACMDRRKRRRRRQFLQKRQIGKTPPESLEPRILLIGDPIDLQPSPLGVGHFLGTTTSELDTSTDVDHWEFEALAGDRIVFAVNDRKFDFAYQLTGKQRGNHGPRAMIFGSSD